ncbi:MAG: hypothetical protein WBQ25_17155 [Nitrososphaeraceae archaeon]
MVSSGIRIGTSDYLQWKHANPVLDDKDQTFVEKQRHNNVIHLP